MIIMKNKKQLPEIDW